MASSQTLERSPHLSWFERRGGLYCYHDIFGHLLAMSPDLYALLARFAEPCSIDEALASLPPSLSRHDARDALATFRAHDCLLSPESDGLEALAERIPVKARWRLVYHTDVAHAFAVVGRNLETTPQLLPIEGWKADLWRGIDGERSVRVLALDLLERELFPAPWGASRAIATVSEQVAAWVHSEVQLLRTHTAPLSFYAHSAPPAHLVSTMPFARRGATARPAQVDDVIDLTTYHQEQVGDAMTQFEDVETTLSHLFREPHPALDGATYAQKMIGWLAREGLLGPHTKDLLEVGGGTGIFAEQAVRAVRGVLDHPFSYRVLDLSPTLHGAQTERLAQHREASTVLGNGEAPPFPPGSFDLVVSNEVIADFRTGRVARETDDEQSWEDPDALLASLEEDDEDPPSLSGDGESIALIERYQLDVREAPPRFLFNLGAVRFVEALYDLLRPGGAAVLTEFGHRWKSPVESTHLDHAEVSIHFGHLASVARQQGFVAEVLDVPDMMDLDGEQEALVATQTWFRNLRFLAGTRGVSLPKLAWTPEMLADRCCSALELERLEGLRWDRLGQRVMGLVPREFLALVIRKPTE